MMRKLIAGIEIIAGIFVILGAVLGIGVRIGSNHLGTEFISWSWPIITSILIVIFFGLINLWGGINLWRNKNSGYFISILAQAIQLISIQTPNFHNVFYTIIGFIISFSKEGISSLYGFGVSYEISLNPQPVTTVYIGINIVALLLLTLIIILYQKKLKLLK